MSQAAAAASATSAASASCFRSVGDAIYFIFACGVSLCRSYARLPLTVILQPQLHYPSPACAGHVHYSVLVAASSTVDLPNLEAREPRDASKNLGLPDIAAAVNAATTTAVACD